MKIKNVKVANAIKCDAEVTFLDAKVYDCEIVQNYLVKVKKRSSGVETYTSLFNVAYFQLCDEKGGNSEEDSKKSGKKASA